MDLRRYQEDGVADIRRSLSHGNKAPLYVLPTGGGKTLMFSHIAKQAASKSNRVMILVHRREILGQTMSKLYGLGLSAGQVAAQSPMTQRSTVQVGMISTVVRRIGNIKRPDLIIVDEAHHAVAGQWQRTLDYWREVPRIGVTATPTRLDGRGLRDVFDDLIVGPTIKELVSDGWLSYPVLYRPAQEAALQLHVRRGDFDRKEQAQALSTRAIIGDVIAHYRETMDGLPAVAFCPTVEHAHLVAEQFNRAGYTAAPVWGNMPDKDRDAAIQGLASGSVQVVTSCDVISEGVDVPVMVGAILLRRTLSLSLYLQQVGRALRPAPGKDRAVILDHVGNRYLHGHVLQPRDWSLDSEKRDPRRESPPMTTECPQCYAVWPGRPHKCPSCGFDFASQRRRQQAADFEVLRGKLEAEHPESDDALLDVAAKAMQSDSGKDRTKELWREAYRLAQDVNGRERIDELRRMMGYKPAWTDIVWKRVSGSSRRRSA
jgi:superfamily II DNA or RNA helicase